MIAADQWRAYNEAVERIRSDASREVERQVSDWLAENFTGDVAAARDEAARIMRAQVATYDQRAAALAAQWYDAQASAAGARLDRAVTAVTYTRHDVDSLAHYQAAKLARGDVDGFAAMCGEFAANDAMKSLNRTIMRNVARDKERGVRFARVASGRNTCAFCLMLAGRGSVYHSRKTAGEFDNWHRHCTCKVVPNFGGDRYDTLVEGHDPRVESRRWERIESAREGRVPLPETPDRAELEAGYARAFEAYKDGGKTEASYQRSIGDFIRGLVPENPIDVESFTMLRGKEIEAAVTLAKLGKSVLLRNDDIHKKTDGNTSDALVDGVTCDFKEIEVAKLKRLVREVTDKLDRQGPHFLVDIRRSGLDPGIAEARISSLLEDPKVEKIYLVAADWIEELKK